MKTRFILKLSVAAGLLGASALALAADSCCTGIECCLQMLACCF